MYVLFTSESFTESVGKVISYGGDTDTNACIVGSMAESLYGISDELKEKALEKLPEEFKLILKRYNKEKR
jgi:ADP-ribosylglycohydrolase